MFSSSFSQNNEGVGRVGCDQLKLITMKKYLLSAIASILMADASAQWQVQNAGFTNDTLGFYAMSLPNAHTVWAICYDGKPGTGLANGRFILDFTRTTNGGATWTPGKMGADYTLQFANISAVSESEAWVAMNKRNTGGGGLYHTTDSGVTWTQSNAGVIFDANSFPNFVHFKDTNNGVAMGDPNGGNFEIYTTSNRGVKWDRVDNTNLPPSLSGEYGWISGFATLGDTIWFGTTAGRMYKSVNFGKSWSVHTVDPAGKFVMEIAFDDDGLHGVAHLRNNQTFLYSTNDGGLTWTDLGKPANWKSSRITAVPGTDALIATSVNGFDLGSSVSYDNGATWTIIDNTVPKAVCRFYDANIGYAGGFFVTGPPLRGGIYKSQITFAHPNVGVTTNAELKSAEATKIYPTPANDVINISLAEDQVKATSMIYVLSMEGKVLQSKRSAGAKLVQLNVDRLTPGMYMIRAASNNKTVSQVITIAR